jgi:hypothetical protein
MFMLGFQFEVVHIGLSINLNTQKELIQLHAVYLVANFSKTDKIQIDMVTFSCPRYREFVRFSNRASDPDEVAVGRLPQP